MSKKSRLARKRFFRTTGAVLVIVALFWLVLAGYFPPEEVSLFRKVPVPEKLEEVLGTAKRLVSSEKEEEPEEPQTPKPKTLSLAEVREEAQEKVVTESKEVVREKVVEILRDLVDKLTDDEKTKSQVCDQVCEEVCQEACE